MAVFCENMILFLMPKCCQVMMLVKATVYRYIECQITTIVACAAEELSFVNCIATWK